MGFAALYSISAGRMLKHPSIAPYYVYMAESLLKGHFHLVTPPPTGYDLINFGGHQYIAPFPLPALMFMPFVWLRGTPTGFPDAAVTSIWGAFNVVLIYVLLGRLRRWMHVSRKTRLALTVLFGAGTSHWYVSALSSMWFTAHVCAVTCVCLYAIEVLGRNRAWLAGLWLGLAGLARPSCWFAFPFFAMTALSRMRRRGRLRQLAAKMLVFWSVPLLCIGLTLLYNHLRFGDPFDSGLAYINGAPELIELYARYGSFDLHFVPRNLHHMLIGLPDVRLQEPPWIHPDPVGMSIFLVTPPLLYVFKSLGVRRLKAAPRLAWDALRRPAIFFDRILEDASPIAPAWLSVLSVTIPLALYHNTGGFQFGYRYVLDWLPIGLILVNAGMKGKMSRWKWILVGASVLIHLGGLLWAYPTFNLAGTAWHVAWGSVLNRLWEHLGNALLYW